MTVPNVSVPHREFLGQCLRHSKVIQGLPDIDPSLQKLLAELVMMRLFDDFQVAIAGVALRLASGAPYADGTGSQLLTQPAGSIASARVLFENYGRSRQAHMKWSRVKFINETTKHVIDPQSHFIQSCLSNSLEISEMQSIRNRIAHSNKSSRGAFSSVVRRYYGANLNHVSPGLLLLSPRQSPQLLSRYVTACQVIVKGCARV